MRTASDPRRSDPCADENSSGGLKAFEREKAAIAPHRKSDEHGSVQEQETCQARGTTAGRRCRKKFFVFKEKCLTLQRERQWEKNIHKTDLYRTAPVPDRVQAGGSDPNEEHRLHGR